MQAKAVGFILIIVGIIMIAYTGFDFVTTKKVVDLGPVQINQETNHPIKWSPVIGVTMLAGGILIIVFSKKTSKI
jgi:hypothetical protein